MSSIIFRETKKIKKIFAEKIMKNTGQDVGSKKRKSKHGRNMMKEGKKLSLKKSSFRYERNMGKTIMNMKKEKIKEKRKKSRKEKVKVQIVCRKN